MTIARRTLLVVADDYGIGPETSRAILELARRGVVTATVLMVNSPYAEPAAGAWRKAQPAADLGWHPCLTLDAPSAPVSDVFTLVDRDGRLRPLSKQVPRLLLGLVRPEHIERELSAQYRRFLELAGEPPTLVNSHQHIALFGGVGAVLRSVLERQSPRPFLRRIQEPVRTIAAIPGAKSKRLLLNALGRRAAKTQARDGFPGADWMLGATDPVNVREPEFWPRWLSRIPGEVVEMMCHPGFADDTLIGRDCEKGDGLLERRVDECARLTEPTFLEAVRRNGFVLDRPSRLHAGGGRRNAA